MRWDRSIYGNIDIIDCLKSTRKKSEEFKWGCMAHGITKWYIKILIGLIEQQTLQQFDTQNS